MGCVTHDDEPQKDHHWVWQPQCCMFGFPAAGCMLSGWSPVTFFVIQVCMWQSGQGLSARLPQALSAERLPWQCFAHTTRWSACTNMDPGFPSSNITINHMQPGISWAGTDV